ncbi:MAG: hypothetical protein ACTSYA_06960 [Candidatus Kariarchaeaceae archaeon]
MQNGAGNTYQWSEEIEVGSSYNFKISYTVDGKAAIDSDNNLEDGTNCFVEVVEEPLFPCSLDWISMKVDNQEIDETSFIVQQGIIEFFLLPLDFLTTSNLFSLIDGFYVHSNTTIDTFLEIKSTAESGVLHSFFYSRSTDNGTIILQFEQMSDEASFTLPSLVLLFGFVFYSVLKRKKQKI